MPPTAGLQREEELGGGGENDECEETNFISGFFFFPELRQMFVFLEEQEEVR